MRRRGDHRSPASFGFDVHSERAQIVCPPRYGSAAKRCAVAALTGKSDFIGMDKASVPAKAPLCKGSCRVATEGLFTLGL